MAQERKIVEPRPQLLVANGFQSDELAVDPAGRRGGDVSNPSNEPTESLGTTLAPLPNYVEGLELVHRAAQAMQTMEDHSLQIQTKAFEVMQASRANRIETAQQMAAMEKQLIAAETKSEQLATQLALAEQRARTAEEWLGRFMEAVNTGFGTKRACQPDKVRSAA